MSKSCNIHKTLEEINSIISCAWDANVVVRAADLESETDASYVNVIKPWVARNVLKLTNAESTILDIGSGCGYLANSLYQLNRPLITGIDLSLSSVDYSIKKYPYINFFHQDIYSFSSEVKYDLCLSVMLLNNMPDLDKYFKVVSDVLKPTGKVLIVIPHPQFWPLKHIDSEQFSYLNRKCYRFKFSTKGRNDYSSKIIYFHRPLEDYINSSIKAGFKIICAQELAEASSAGNPEIMCFILTK